RSAPGPHPEAERQGNRAVNLDRWLMTTRIAYAPEGETGAAAPETPAAAEAAPAASEAAAAPAPSALAAADSNNRDGATKGDTPATPESAGSEAGKETPPPGGPSAKSEADGAKP